jgi:hypothetical protein
VGRNGVPANTKIGKKKGGVGERRERGQEGNFFRAGGVCVGGGEEKGHSFPTIWISWRGLFFHLCTPLPEQKKGDGVVPHVKKNHFLLCVEDF